MRKPYNKYHNIKTEIDNVVFDSKVEGRRYSELKLMLNAGLIYDLVLQPVFPLQPSFKKNGKTIRAIAYISDFAYKTKDGAYIIEDVKSKKTCKIPAYLLKKKMFEYIYKDLSITEVIL